MNNLVTPGHSLRTEVLGEQEEVEVRRQIKETQSPEHIFSSRSASAVSLAEPMSTTRKMGCSFPEVGFQEDF